MARHKSFSLFSIAMAGALAYAAVEISQSFTEDSVALDTPIAYNASSLSGNGLQLAANEMLVGPMAAFMKKDSIAGELRTMYKARTCGDCHATPADGGDDTITGPRLGQRAQIADFMKHFFTFLNSL